MYISGRLPANIRYRLSAYFRTMTDVTEYGGALLNMVNDEYDPLDDLHTGRGRAYGLSAMLSGNFGQVTSSVSYTLGRTEGLIDKFGKEWFPLSYDRRHDLCLTVAWRPWRDLSLSATAIYATGFPYTKATYGYMIGENLICEYDRHNSSRLPAYKRVDIGATWVFCRKKVITHKLNLSLYNVCCFENVIFDYVTYSVKNGIRHEKSVLQLIIPSLSYSLQI